MSIVTFTLFSAAAGADEEAGAFAARDFLLRFFFDEPIATMVNYKSTARVRDCTSK